MTDMTRDAAFAAVPADPPPVRSAFTGAVVARAAIVALILGSLLALANQGARSSAPKKSSFCPWCWST